MFKKLSIFLALFVICLMPGTVLAGDVVFPKLKISVPDGWTATLDGDTLGMVANDKSASMSVTVDKTDGASLKDLASEFSKQLKGTKPTRDKSGYYEFTFKSSKGIESNAMVTGDKKEYVFIVVTGKHAQIKDILLSIDIK